MKITCDIIGDLLPLYLDEACSEESKKEVEEHLRNCKKCAEDMRLMQSELKANSPEVQEEKIIKAAEKSWKKGKNKAFFKGCLIILLCVAVIIGGYVSYHFFTTVNENDAYGLIDQAKKIDDNVVDFKKIEKRGDYMAVMCKNKKGEVCLCEFERDSLFKNRWFASGGKSFIEKGEIGCWNYGSPKGEAVIIFFGINIPENVAYYKFENSGITYTCPVENGSVLDVFVIQNNYDINGYPILLDKNGKEIEF